MKLIKKNKTLAYLIIGFVLLQGSIVGYSLVNNELFNNMEPQATNETVTIETSPTIPVIDASVIQGDVNTENIEIIEEIQEIIKQSDPANFDKNITNYKNLLINLNVHIYFKDEIERLLKNGNKIGNILIAYEFLFDNYGKKDEIEMLANEKATGKTWVDVFREYNTKNTEFVPSNFDSNYLEELMKTPGLNKDDIMIADRVAKKSSLKISDVLSLRTNTNKWKVINASLGIINSQQILPRVPVTPDQVNKYVSGDITEQKVIEAIVIANKLKVPHIEVVEMFKNGLSKEEVYAKYYEIRYY